MLELVVVGEAPADVRIARDLADRVLVEAGPDWIQEQDRDYFINELLPGLRRWSGLNPDQTHSTWRDVRQLSRNYPELTFLRRPSAPGQSLEHLPDYVPVRKAILLSGILRKGHFPHALVLIRDLDNQAERKAGMHKARADEELKVIVVLATPNPKREAWVLNGFVCQNQQEEQELKAIRQQINFHPCQEAHRLRYASQTSRPERDPKKILERLTGNSGEREAQCWLETPLATLRKYGVETYLKEFLNEIADRLLPLFSS